MEILNHWLTCIRSVCEKYFHWNGCGVGKILIYAKKHVFKINYFEFTLTPKDNLLSTFPSSFFLFYIKWLITLIRFVLNRFFAILFLVCEKLTLIFHCIWMKFFKLKWLYGTFVGNLLHITTIPLSKKTLLSIYHF